jgi:hypothetical protein
MTYDQGPAGGECYLTQRTNGGGRWLLSAFCPLGGKILSGSGAYYRNDSNSPAADFFGSDPVTFAHAEMERQSSFPQRVGAVNTAGTSMSTVASINATREGWRIVGENSAGYDALTAYALCALP